MAYLGWANALSTIQITDESVTVTVFYGRFRILWNEVEKIVLSSPLIALIGNSKRVVLSLAFAGKSGSKMLEFFNQQIEKQTLGEPAHWKPGSILQLEEQPSPLVTPASSHCSPPETIPSPQRTVLVQTLGTPTQL